MVIPSRGMRLQQLILGDVPPLQQIVDRPGHLLIRTTIPAFRDCCSMSRLSIIRFRRVIWFQSTPSPVPALIGRLQFSLIGFKGAVQFRQGDHLIIDNGHNPVRHRGLRRTRRRRKATPTRTALRFSSLCTSNHDV